MSLIGQPERATQNRVISLFEKELGYQVLGDWTDRTNNSNIEPDLLRKNLTERGYRPDKIARALHHLTTEARNANRNLYDNNKAVYNLLRYGVSVKVEAGENSETIHIIDWENPEANDFAIAEEVTLHGNHERRPDLVIYLNGIAVCVIELKNSRTSIGNGIRQLLSNQTKDFNEWFFSTVQIVIAGNDSQGLQYGTIGTEEKYFLKWKEDEKDNSRNKLDKYLLKMLTKRRLLELLHDFVLFDGGKKKLPRVHQYFAIKEAQQHVNAYRGGIIWHTQGSGKSIVMVLLAKWILENKPKARVIVVTDRDELDKQIENVFLEAGESVVRTRSGRDLMAKLGQPTPRILCTLLHKFGQRGLENFEAFISELEAQPPQTVGELFVFVDECHRSESGKLHKTMKAILKNAVFIGFTGTPLLKSDKKTSLEVFGGYIHTYKFSEGVADGVVLDLAYEARDIDQRLGSQEHIDAWFEAKTRGLNSWQKRALKDQWGTMQNVLSSRSRMERVVQDVVFDFGTRPRLETERGNAILVASSIYEACKYYTLFQQTVLRNKCAVVTSYDPQAKDISLEETGANSDTDKQFLFSTYTALLKDISPDPQKSKTETYEDRVKQLFIEQPANMKILVVVDKLLTGFDAPSCTYLYIDKSMRDHGLFQAICRTNRLDGDDKDFGYIVDYKDLFRNLVNEKGTGALQVYSSELDDSAPGAPSDVTIQDRLTKGRERLNSALEAIELLCEPVKPPKGEDEYRNYFCGNTEIPSDLQEREPQRMALYEGAAKLMRAYANIADDLKAAGYSDVTIEKIKASVKRTVDLRETIRHASGETIDLKAFEADMRHLIDTYIEADAPRKISAFENMGLLETIVQSGVAEALRQLPEGIRSSQQAVAETIANNVRKKIIKEHLNDPAYYDQMSALLAEIISDLRARRIDYAEYLRRIGELAKNVQTGHTEDTSAQLKASPALRALYNNLGHDEDLAVAVDNAVKKNKPDGWRDVQAREQMVKAALYQVLKDDDEVERIFLIVKQQAEY